MLRSHLHCHRLIGKDEGDGVCTVAIRRCLRLCRPRLPGLFATAKPAAWTCSASSLSDCQFEVVLSDKRRTYKGKLLEQLGLVSPRQPFFPRHLARLLIIPDKAVLLQLAPVPPRPDSESELTDDSLSARPTRTCALRPMLPSLNQADDTTRRPSCPARTRLFPRHLAGNGRSNVCRFHLMRGVGLKRGILSLSSS